MSKTTAYCDGLKLVVIIPALDEEKTVGDVIGNIPQAIPGVSRIQVLVVDDGSTDETGRVAREAGARVLRHASTRGVGAAFQTGVREAIEMGADVVVNIDADGQFDPQDIPKLITPIIEKKADCVTASRFIDPDLTPEMPFWKRWGNRRMSRLIGRLTGQRWHDVSCGMRAYSRRAALSLNLIGRFTYTQEVFLALSMKGLSILEVPVKVRGEREYGRSRVARSLWRYAFQTMKIILRCHRDYYPMRFFGRIALILGVVGLACWGFLLVHYLHFGKFSPHKWAGFVGATFVGLAVFALQFGIIGDMLNRHRLYLEEILYHARDRRADRSKDQNESSDSDSSGAR